MNNTTKPVKVRLSFRLILGCVLFTLFTLIIGYGIFVISTQTIYMEDDTPMPTFFKALIIAVALFVEIGLLFIVVPLWKRIFKDGSMTLTQAGIENTFMIFTVLAFWTTLRIRVIPWTALTDDKADENGYKVDVNQLPPGSVGTVAKFLLRIIGFNFRIGRIKKEDLERYRHMVLVQSENDSRSQQER